MGRVYKAEFRHKAVRLALSSSLSRERIAQDLGIGSSTLKTWIRDAQKLDTVVADTTDHTALSRENERLRRENLLLREERELLKRRHSSSRAKSREVCLKAELLWQQAWMSRQEVEQAITSYINDFYNAQRLHSALQWKSPLDYERNAA